MAISTNVRCWAGLEWGGGGSVRRWYSSILSVHVDVGADADIDMGEAGGSGSSIGAGL